MQHNVRVGCAGWTIPSEQADSFPAAGTHLQRYAARFSIVEINTSFDKPPRQKTYQDWAAVVPPSFRFAVKLPKQINDVIFILGQLLQASHKTGPWTILELIQVWGIMHLLSHNNLPFSRVARSLLLAND
jgi:uncharacterized protein YecE (DUF72 family)